MDEAQEKDPDRTESQEAAPQPQTPQTAEPQAVETPASQPVAEPAESPPAAAPRGNDAAATDSPPQAQDDAPGGAEQAESEFPPESLDSELDPDDKPIGELAIEEDEEDAGVSESPPAAEAEQPSPADDQAAEDQSAAVDTEEAAAKLEELRPLLAAAIFGEERPPKAAAQQQVEDYVAVLRAANAAASDQWEQLLSLIDESNQQQLAKENAGIDQAAGEMKRHVEVYDTLFAELAGLLDAVGAQLQQMNDQDDSFQQAPDALRTTLANYKKGIEIVQRMISRTRDRKKELSAELPVSIGQEVDKVDVPEDADQFAAGALALSEAFHNLRDANYHATQDAKGAADKCLQATLAALKQILSAVDGIDSGLASEPQVRAKVAEIEDDATCHALAESWFGAYGRLTDCVDTFLSKTGIEAHTVAPGTPFDPNTMEPQGTVENTEMNNEDVATVLRRGFSLHGQPIRPILVDVVRNP